MIYSPINKSNKQVLQNTFDNIEKISNSDVFVFYSDFLNSIDNVVKDLIENLATPKKKHNNLIFIIDTNGGGIAPVIRIVNILRHFYKTIDFYVPDHAYSAGTIICCSGDRIFMDYNSVLGPIDPQVMSKNGDYVSALGYLDRLETLIEKAKKDEITKPEFMILKDFDLGEWRAFEQARDLATDLLSEWLPKYKFKDWKKHSSTKKKVTLKEKRERATEIAKELGKNTKWKSHGRPINRAELEKLKLKIDKMEQDKKLYLEIMKYHDLVRDFMVKFGLRTLLQTRKDMVTYEK